MFAADQPYPRLEIRLLTGDSIALPDFLDGQYRVVLFYRGSWCRTGAFLDADPLYLQSTGFVLDPRGRIVVSVYSSGAIGRLVPDDIVGLIPYHRQPALSAD